ncbi:MAG: hypothetical protein GY945_08165 [Rhodobacteraceae bacterium]|nr:hypothetical protein [Paracoccaceae bacterium]
MGYLNDVEEGGETGFPALKISVRPRLGHIVIFSNTQPGNDHMHPHAFHAGFPPEAGEKWAMVMW